MELLREMCAAQGSLSFVPQCLKPSTVPEEAEMLLLHHFFLVKKLLEAPPITVTPLCTDYESRAVGVLRGSQNNSTC